jgi:hypothetical protein
MELSIKERLTLSGVLEPQQGRVDMLKIIRQFREDLSLSPAEIKVIGLREIPDTNRVVWDVGKEFLKDVPIPSIIMERIVYAFKRGEAMGTLQEEWIELYEKFMPFEEELKSALKEGKVF